MRVLRKKLKNLGGYSVKKHLRNAFLAVLFAFLSLFSSSALILSNPNPAFSEPVTLDSEQIQQTLDKESKPSTNSPDASTPETPSDSSTDSDEDACYAQTGAVGWLICPSTGVLAKAIDGIYSVIENLLKVKPLSFDSTSPIYQVWRIFRDITNIVFIIFILIIITSQITGIGITNYGIKKTLPKIIIAAILVNMSYIICSIVVDVSNITGASFRDLFSTIQEQAISAVPADSPISSFSFNWSDIVAGLAGGGVIAGIAIGAAGGLGALFWVLMTVLLGAAVSVIIAFITIAARQAFISLLIMISPLAFVCYLLPNTNSWFNKWKQMFTQMLFFYPMFSILFGASELAGWVIIASADNAIYVILGMAVEIFPLIASWSLLKMSGTIPGQIGAALTRASARPLSSFRTFATEQKNTRRAEYTARNMKNARFNPLSGRYLNAKIAEARALRLNRSIDAKRNLDTLTAERITARKDGRKILGYDSDGRPVYSKVKDTRELQNEFAIRENTLRLRASTTKLDNDMSTMGKYIDKNKIKNEELETLARSQAENYIDLETQLSASRRNALADKRFYHQQIEAAARRNARTGEIIDVDAYNRLIVEGAGADAHIHTSIRPGTQEYIDASQLRNDAISSVIADSYSAIEAERKTLTMKYTTYLSKQVTKEVLAQYEGMLENKNIEGIVAAQDTLALRGDYDKIKEHLHQYMDREGYVQLGTDFANTLALNLLKMKDADPELARLGKHINVETWHYTDWDPEGDEPQRASYVTYREFMTGKDANGGTTKYNIKTLLRGTAVKGIDRTFYAGLKESIDRYCTSEVFGSDADAEQARIDIMTEMLPQIISALPTFPAGSEQITNTLNFLTGFTCGADGQWTLKAKDRPHFEANRHVYKKMTKAYLEGLTANDLVNLKTDTFNALLATFKELYGTDDEAHRKFLEFTKNQRAALAASEPGVLAPMKVKIRKYLGLAPDDLPDDD